MGKLYYRREIVEALDSYYKGNPFDILPIYDDIFKNTGDLWLNQEIANICDENNLCPLCFKRTTLKTSRQFNGECRGEPAYEEITIRHCENCGWSD